MVDYPEDPDLEGEVPKKGEKIGSAEESQPLMP